MIDRVLRNLIEELLIGYYPNLVKLKSALEILIFREKNNFYDVLAYFEEYTIILIHQCKYGIKRIIPHPRLELNELKFKLFVNRLIR